jgi:hypothetical protein
MTAVNLGILDHLSFTLQRVSAFFSAADNLEKARIFAIKQRSFFIKNDSVGFSCFFEIVLSHLACWLTDKLNKSRFAFYYVALMTVLHYNIEYVKYIELEKNIFHLWITLGRNC